MRLNTTLILDRSFDTYYAAARVRRLFCFEILYFNRSFYLWILGSLYHDAEDETNSSFQTKTELSYIPTFIFLYLLYLTLHCRLPIYNGRLFLLASTNTNTITIYSVFTLYVTVLSNGTLHNHYNQRFFAWKLNLLFLSLRPFLMSKSIL